MSAIFGILHFTDNKVNLTDANAILEALENFPSDDVQTWSEGPALLGCHAQWITPESVGERLPFFDSERGVAITADAMIDNRVELFDALGVDRSKRETMTDSELILHAYYRWGEEAPAKLIGDFAFVIWDERNDVLFGARDFSGARTLYYFRDSSRIAFCTIMSPLLALPYVGKRLNDQWIAEFLAIPFTADTTNPGSSVYSSIEQLPPSHSFNLRNGRIALRRYCRLAEGTKLKLKTDEEYEEAFREVFHRAVKDRTRTRKLVGAHLSGGLDSGSVASFAAKALRDEKKQLLTYSYIPVEDFQDWTPKSRVANERPNIQETVRFAGNMLDHYLDFNGQSPYSEIDEWLDILEMPYKFFENSFWLKGIYHTAHRHGVGILLNGQRGNWTISWGPALDYQAKLLKSLRWIDFYREFNSYSRAIGAKRSRLLKVVGKKAFPSLHAFSSEREYRHPVLINADFARRTNVADILMKHQIDISGAHRTNNAYDIRRRQFDQLFYWNINGTYGTKLSLRHALWDRDPTNDLRVIQFCLSVPDDQFVRDGMGRALIRRSTRDYLPERIRYNQKVRGVQGADGIHRMAPVWGEFVEEIRKLTRDDRVAAYLDVKVLSGAVDTLSSGPEANMAFSDEFRIAMRGLIFSRFLKKHGEGGERR